MIEEASTIPERSCVNFLLKKQERQMTILKKILLLAIVLVAPSLSIAPAFANNFTLDYQGRVYDSQTDTTTFTYELCWNGTPPALSHFVLGVPNCDPDLLVVTSGLNALNGCQVPGQPANDGSTGTYGVKWDNCNGFTGCDTFNVKFAGNKGETDINWLAKAGPCNSLASCSSGVTTGPSCEPGNTTPVCLTSCPNNLECGNGVGSIAISGAASYDPDCVDALGAGAPECELDYEWSNLDCPDAQFDDTTAVTPILTMNTEHPPGVPLSCTVKLKVTDVHGAFKQCRAIINVGECQFDCFGEPGGLAQFDDCGVCEGGNQAKDDCGVCFGNNENKDDCGVCFGNNEDKDDCGVCNGGNQDIDQCGVCFGDNTSCADCAGVPNGTAVLDACGVCDGDGTSCLDCAGVPNGTSVLDACGVCDGDGTSCLDCAGVPNGTAVLDTCGVCDGDGSSCVNVCEESNILSELLELDGLGLEYKSYIEDLARRLKKRTGKTKSGNKQIKQASELYTSSWELTWSIPQQIQTNCTNAEQCVTVSHVSALSGYEQNHSAFGQLANQLLKQLKKNGLKVKKLQKRKNKIDTKEAELISKIPVSSESCS